MENTSNYGLKRWDGEDRILHTEFNDNWDKIDTALKANADAVAAETAVRDEEKSPASLDRPAGQLLCRIWFLHGNR